MKRSKVQTNQQGLSLVEVLVSMTLMTVLIVAITSPLAGLFQYSKDSKESVEANSAARSALETARAAWQTYPWINPNEPGAEATNQQMQEFNIASLIRFNKNCAGPDVLDQIDQDLHQNIVFEVFQLDRYNAVAQTLDSSDFTSNCDDVDEGPYMPAKRIQVSVLDDEGNAQIAAHVDMRAPTTSIPVGSADEN